MTTENLELTIERYPETKEELQPIVLGLIKVAGEKGLRKRLKEIDGFKDRIGDYTYDNIINGKASMQAMLIFINSIKQLIEIEKFNKEKGYYPAIEIA